MLTINGKFQYVVTVEPSTHDPNFEVFYACFNTLQPAREHAVFLREQENFDPDYSNQKFVVTPTNLITAKELQRGIYTPPFRTKRNEMIYFNDGNMTIKISLEYVPYIEDDFSCPIVNSPIFDSSDYTLITDSQKIHETLEAVMGSNVGAYMTIEEYGIGSIFVRIDDGDYSEIWACPNCVPRIDSTVHCIYTKNRSKS